MATPLTPQQKRFRQLSNETKQIIQNQLNTLLDDIVESVYIHSCENDSPNGMDFWDENEKELLIANEYILAVLNGDEG